MNKYIHKESGAILLEPFEPKMKNRWLVNFPTELDIPSYVVSETQRPSVEIKRGFFGQKRMIHNPIRFKLLDPIDPSTSRSVAEFYNKFNQGKLKPFDYTLVLLDPTGSVIEHWDIKNCEILSMNFGELKYGGQTEVVTLEMVVKPKSFILQY